MSRSILVVAGEVSGDMHAARLIRQIQAKDPDVRFWGIGGPCMREAGVETLVDIEEMAVMGLVEVLKRYGFFRKVFHDLLEQTKERQPDAALFIDYPGFNLRFAKKTRELGIPNLFYICPQVWAWKASRIPKMAAILDELMVIFPFEVELFKDTGLSTHYVGHPLLEEIDKAKATEATELPWGDGTEPRLAMLPGSRAQELDRILDCMRETVKLLPEARPIWAAANEKIAERLRRETDGPVVVGQTREILRQADAGMVVSGTATLEAALMDCPMIVVYKTSPVTYAIGKRVVNVPHIGMVNVVAGDGICPEFIQDAALPTEMSAALKRVLVSGPEQEQMLAGLKKVDAKLRDRAGMQSAADIVISALP